MILHVYLNIGARADFTTSFCYLIQCSLLLSLCLLVYYSLFKNCNSKIISRAPSGANQRKVCVLMSITHSYTLPFSLGLVDFWTHRVVVFGVLCYLNWFTNTDSKPQKTPVNRSPSCFLPALFPYLLTLSPHWTILLHCLFFPSATSKFMYTQQFENNMCDSGEIKNHL